MSYIGEVLKSARNAEMVNLNSKLNSLSKTISAFKLEVINMLGTIYIDFDILGIEEGNRLSIQKKQLLEDIVDVDGRINTQIEKDVKKSGEELKKLTIALKELKFEMDIINGLLNINDMLNRGHDMLKELDWHSMVDFAQHINQIESLLESKNADTSNYKQLDIYIHLKDELCLLKQKFLISTLDEYKSNIIWWEVFQDEMTSEPKKIVIKIHQQEQRKHYVQCLHLMDSLSQEISVFSNSLLNDVLKPITRGKATVSIVNLLNHVNIQVEFKSEPGNASGQGRSVQESSDIIENMIMLFNALYSYLHFHLDPDASHVSANIIGIHLISSGAVRSHAGFLGLDHQSSPFCDYRKENMSCMVINKKCTMYLDQARTIMKKSLQVMKQVEPRDVSELMNATLNRKIAEAMQDEGQVNNSICANLFQFPKCFVSESTLELLDLTQALLADLCTEQDTVCNKLCHTMLNIFIMYCDVMPLYHQKLLDSTPEASALLHNNCMYIAHHLCTLSDTYREQLSKSSRSESPSVKYDLIFVDLVVMLRNLSKETLNRQLDVQRALLKQYVKQSGLDSISTQLSLDPNVEKQLRAALSQLSFLRTAWENILPRHIYCRSMGSLVTSLIKEVIACLVNTSDITSHVSQALLLLFDMIQNHVTMLMPVSIPCLYSNISHVGSYVIKEVIACLVSTSDITSHVLQALLLFGMIQNHVNMLMPVRGWTTYEVPSSGTHHIGDRNNVNPFLDEDKTTVPPDTSTKLPDTYKNKPIRFLSKHKDQMQELEQLLNEFAMFISSTQADDATPTPTSQTTLGEQPNEVLKKYMVNRMRKNLNGVVETSGKAEKNKVRRSCKKRKRIALAGNGNVENSSVDDNTFQQDKTSEKSTADNNFGQAVMNLNSEKSGADNKYLRGKVTLLHNNCMYIAHHLCTLSDTYREQLSKSSRSESPSVKYDLIFVDLVVMLRNLSKETLNRQLDVQRALLKQYVKQSGLDSISTQLSLDPNVEKQLRAALSQLSFLRTAWENILPRHIYCRSMGSLVTSLIKEVIACLVNTSDITSHVSQALLLLFDMIQNHVTMLMPEEVQKTKLAKFVKNWNKFLELIKIFNSTSPRDIEDSWNCGRGPLAQEFSPGEVKNLIRALIQASARREALLEKIN
ncbi:centromere/kinetochore protein zw10 homolog [Diaphorina citri]|uniref:Centromere/kinetochore protein zw10 homolog n=1 Tax=Diaphorina citri TaxID=121845 RepID=A0A3Q0II42_DIACI|nr:centromere/kinetochore protein zw10 homolog [Diaphorina citri]